MRAFVSLWGKLLSHQDLAWKLLEMEKKYDTQFAVVFDDIRRLMEAPPAPARRMGFHPPNEETP